MRLLWSFDVILDDATYRMLGALQYDPSLWDRCVEEHTIDLQYNVVRNTRNKSGKRRPQDEPCPGCGTHDFERRPKGKLRVYCSDKCRKRMHNAALNVARRKNAGSR